MKKKVAVLLAVCLLVCLLAGCGSKTQNPDTTPAPVDTAAPEAAEQTVTDMLGRSVTVPTDIESVACIGAGALRLYSYIGDMDKLCGVEECEYGFLISVRPYQMVNAERFAALDGIGAGGPQGSPDAEAILAASPDVIFSLYTSDVSAMDELQTATGIPVVVLSYGDTEAFDDDLFASITLMGQVLGREERASAVNDYINAMLEDLNSRTKDIPDAEKKTVYLGCQSNYGSHGIESSTANYSLFNAVNARNILDENGYEGYQSQIDLEALVQMDPEVIILDAGGLSLLKDEYGQSKPVFDSLSAFKSGEVYLQMPYNAYYTNLEIAYADAYFIGTVLYPEQFADVDPAEKFDEISEFMLGAPCYDAIAAQMFGGYQKLDIAATLG